MEQATKVAMRVDKTQTVDDPEIMQTNWMKYKQQTHMEQVMKDINRLDNSDIADINADTDVNVEANIDR